MWRAALARRAPRAATSRPQVRRCGLVAAFDFEQTTARTLPATIADACERIAHRGPDGRGFAASAAAASSSSPEVFRWALGHTRLAIVAPHETAAAQPFDLRVSEGRIDGAVSTTHAFAAPASVSATQRRIALAANGEIYTHKALYASIDHPAATSRSDCEVIAHLYAACGPRETMRRLTDAGMFAFVLVDDARQHQSVFAARDPTGIKPLYYGRDAAGRVVAFASELKALVAIPKLDSVHEMPAGTFYYDGHFEKYYQPAWASSSSESDSSFAPRSDEADRAAVRDALDQAVAKRMMTDVPFGLFLSGGVDSCIVAQLMVKRCRDLYGSRHAPPSYTVGMENSPDLTAARAMAKVLGTEHHERIFTADEAIDVVDSVVYHMETYNAELIRSAVPNWFLAERAARDVKMVLTGEGADELWAGYAYFKDAPSGSAVHRELTRIYGHLGVANLLRTDRMTMAHSLEARVPFLDVANTAVAMAVDPVKKLTAGRLGPNGEPGEKAFLRTCFDREHGGLRIPKPLLWRAKAMQAEGVGQDWVATLQAALSARVSDADFADAAARFPHETPQSKEEYYYREVFERHYPHAERVPTLWPGGCRAGGAEWQTDTYTRFGLADVSRLSHAYQAASAPETTTTPTEEEEVPVVVSAPPRTTSNSAPSTLDDTQQQHHVAAASA